MSPQDDSLSAADGGKITVDEGNEGRVRIRIEEPAPVPGMAGHQPAAAEVELEPQDAQAVVEEIQALLRQSGRRRRRNS